MSRPGENPQTKEIKGQSPFSEKAPDPGIDHVHEDDKSILADAGGFVSASEKLDKVEKQQILDKAKEWEKKGDLDLLRSAGLSLDQLKKAPLDRHIKLAALFLQREKGDGLSLRLHFQGNEMAEWDIDLADILPANILKVDIYDNQGKLIYPGAQRGFADGRPGYFHGEPPVRIAVQENYLVKVKQTQPTLAFTDKRAGYKTNIHAFKEEIYLVDNARKGALKEEFRKHADAKGKEVKTDKSFFDNILTDVMKGIDPKFWKNFQRNFKLDFDKILGPINTLIASLGFEKLPSKPGSSAEEHPTGTTYFGTDKMGKTGNGAESLNAPRINRDWLLANVARSPEQVEKFMVRINFLGVNIRVNKLIAPYLAEAESRVRSAGLNIHLKQEQCSCQNWRPIRGGTELSNHSWGVAVDLNSIDNPWQPHLNGSNHGGKMVSNWPPEFVSIMKDVGFKWGGEWSGRADPMHFEMAANPYQNRNVLRSSSAQQLASQYLS